MKTISIFGSLISAAGLFLALMPQFLLPVCNRKIELENGGTAFMSCHYTGVFVTVMGILIVMLGILTIVFHNPQAAVALGLQGIVIAISTDLVSGIIIGVCKNETMPCHMGTLPGVLVVSTLIVILSIIQIIFGIKTKK